MVDLWHHPRPTQAVIDEPAMVMGFISADLYTKLRQMASEKGCSESQLVSNIVREALVKRPRGRRTS